MYVFRKIQELRKYLDVQAYRAQGFVPTMGALHQGHISLLQRSKEETGLTTVSIFVNPTQFNDPADLEKYPRTLSQDLELLRISGCDAVFVPSVEEIYPDGVSHGSDIDLRGLDIPMEGIFRPGHFKGMAQVVHRLLDIVRPQKLFMGQKDYQQYAIVRQMICTLQLPVEIVLCPTVREADGLAMSSRNARLSPDLRARAPVIHEALQYCAIHIEDTPIAKLQEEAIQRLAIPGFRPEYFEIVDGNTLLPADADTEFIVACCAVWAGDVRLIDNVIVKGRP
jgi:pantoate--beta-alanine ligase